jgi:hypothetical protein
MQDGKLLHFLKEFPAWLVLMALFGIAIGFYWKTGDQFFQRILDTILGGLLTVLYGRFKPGPTTVNAEKVETGDVILPKGENK